MFGRKCGRQQEKRALEKSSPHFLSSEPQPVFHRITGGVPCFSATLCAAPLLVVGKLSTPMEATAGLKQASLATSTARQNKQAAGTTQATAVATPEAAKQEGRPPLLCGTQNTPRPGSGPTGKECWLHSIPWCHVVQAHHLLLL